MPAHCTPEYDEREHVFSVDCWCDPRVEYINEDTGLPYGNGPLVVHNSADHREFVERLLAGSFDNKPWRATLVD